MGVPGQPAIALARCAAEQSDQGSGAWHQCADRALDASFPMLIPDMQWPWVARSRLEAANGVIERVCASLRAERELTLRLDAQLAKAQAQIQGAKVPTLAPLKTVGAGKSGRNAKKRGKVSGLRGKSSTARRQ